MTRQVLIVTVNGVSKSAAEWGMRGIVQTEQGLAVDDLRWTMPVKDVTTDLPFQDGDSISMFLCNARPDGTPLDSGEKVFEGEIRVGDNAIEPGAESVSYSAVNIWAQIEATTYKQEWLSVGQGMTLCCLFLNTKTEMDGSYEQLPGTKVITCGQQIYDSLDWMRDHLGAAFYLGQARNDVEPKGLEVNPRQVFDTKVHEVMRLSLEYAPDALGYFRYNERDKPVFYLRRHKDMNTVTLTIGNTGKMRVQAGALVPRYDLQVPAVHLIYTRTNTVDNKSRLQTIHDYHPPEAWNDTLKELKPWYQLHGGITRTTQLQGVSASYQKSDFKGRIVAPWNPQWWKENFPTLNDPTHVKRFTLKSTYDVVDKNTGAPLKPVFDDHLRAGKSWYTVDDGSVPSWLVKGGQAQKLDARIFVQYESEHPTGGLERETAWVDATLASIPPGEYKTLSSMEFADPIPAGTAQWAYESTHTLMWEGTVTVKEQECSMFIHVGDKLNLVNKAGGGKWANMQAIVQRIVRDWDRGTTTITLGLPAWLGVPSLLKFFSENRRPLKWTNSAVMGDDTKSASSETEGPSGTPNNAMLKANIDTYMANFISDATKDNRVEVIGGVTAKDERPAKVGPAVNVVAWDTPVAQLGQTEGYGNLILSYQNGAQVVNMDPQLIAGKGLATWRPIQVCVNDGSGWTQKTMYVLGCLPS